MTAHPDEESRWLVYREDVGVWVSSPPIHHGGSVLPKPFFSWEEAIVDAVRRSHARQGELGN